MCWKYNNNNNNWKIWTDHSSGEEEEKAKRKKKKRIKQINKTCYTLLFLLHHPTRPRYTHRATPPLDIGPQAHTMLDKYWVKFMFSLSLFLFQSLSLSHCRIIHFLLFHKLWPKYFHIQLIINARESIRLPRPCWARISTNYIMRWYIYI